MNNIETLKRLAEAAGFHTIETEGASPLTNFNCYAKTPIDVHDKWIAEFESLNAVKYFEAANPQAILELIERLEIYEAALRFYANPNNWADVWCDEFVEREGDVAARIDYEDCERLTDNDGIYFGPAGRTAREALEKGSAK